MFKVGDKVLILCHHVPGRPYDPQSHIDPNTIGTITVVVGQGPNDSYQVQYPGSDAHLNGYTDGWYFSGAFLQLAEPSSIMPEPDFTLDEIELAEKMIGHGPA